MEKNHDDVYRENLRKKLGLGEKKIAEEAPVEGETSETIDTSDTTGEETIGHEEAETPDKEAKEQSSPEAKAILDEILQYVDEKDKEAPDVRSKLMLKSLFSQLSKSADKIAQKMADDSAHAQ